MIQKRYEINDKDVVYDVCVATMLQPCMIMQHSREMRIRSEDPGSFCMQRNYAQMV